VSLRRLEVLATTGPVRARASKPQSEVQLTGWVRAESPGLRRPVAAVAMQRPQRGAAFRAEGVRELPRVGQVPAVVRPARESQLLAARLERELLPVWPVPAVVRSARESQLMAARLARELLPAWLVPGVGRLARESQLLAAARLAQEWQLTAAARLAQELMPRAVGAAPPVQTQAERFERNQVAARNPGTAGGWARSRVRTPRRSNGTYFKSKLFLFYCPSVTYPTRDT